MQNDNPDRAEILLAVLPFWTPLIPPLGLACLKSYLQSRGYRVKTLDANIEDRFKEIYRDYFNILAQCVPEYKQGNFYSIGHDVLRNHLLAFLRQDNEKKYRDLVKVLVYHTYFCSIGDNAIEQLHRTVREFFQRLKDYFIDGLGRVKPRVLGISVTSDTLPAALAAFQLTRERYPHIMTVMGGGVFADQLAPGSPNLEIFLEQTESFIDKIIIGEGEELFFKLLEREFSPSQRVITRKEIDNEYLHLTAIEVPDFSDFQLEYYPYMTTYTSRSCPFQCSFCAETVNWGKYRKKPIAQCVDELALLYEKHGYRMFLIGDSLLNPVITDLAGALTREKLPVYWDGYLRVDGHSGDIDKTILWRQGGFYRARLGIESGSPHILKAMGKQITPGQIKQAVSSLARAGIKTTTYWIIGYPGETENHFQQTLELVAELKDNLYEAECKPFYYYLTGQVKSGAWFSQYKKKLLYPEEFSKMLLLKTWILDGEPRREQTYQRVSRFAAHCRDLGIPNPYTLNEIYQADERWKKIHKNAVPSLVALKEKDFDAREREGVKSMKAAQNIFQEESENDFGF